MSKRKILLTATIAATFVAGSALAASRDYVSIVGSSTVYPFATVVAEQFGKSTEFKTPKVESTGSGGGFKLFCAGVGVEHPDITNASRRMKKTELEMCKKNGVADVIEIKIGYDGIAIANSKKGPELSLTTRDVFLALAKEVPDPKGGEKLIANPYKTWKDVNSSLPATAIEVLGPPPTSGTRDAFAELAMEGGCKSFPWIKQIKKDSKKAKKAGDKALSKQLKSKYKGICHTVREDGAYIEAGENDNLIVQKLDANPNAVGVFGFSFLDENLDKVQGSTINGVNPKFETISDGSYPISRPLYFYVKKAHVKVVPGVHEFVESFTSDSTYGDDGYLSERGLIPMPKEERAAFTKAAKELIPLSSL
ncbi:MAG: phosphate ABC transporter substrate-binding protein [Cycloclasticus sp.]|nr:phosphate ABC transporter substrate-binding protein [Cycloclasticus sp.]MBG95378.1 phosphate ABC transporter substrate-binding protein [Cycloclasticus sp.]